MSKTGSKNTDAKAQIEKDWHFQDTSDSLTSSLWGLELFQRPSYTHTRAHENTHIYIIVIMSLPLARISLTLSRHLSLSSIASARSSRPHPVFVQSCCR